MNTILMWSLFNVVAEGTNEGMISWAFSIEDEDGNQYTYDKVEVLFERTVYKSGEVSGTVRSDTKIVPLILDDQGKKQSRFFFSLNWM